MEKDGRTTCRFEANNNYERCSWVQMLSRHIYADLDKVLAAFSEEQIDRLCMEVMIASRMDKRHMTLADKIRELADMGMIDSPEWKTLVGLGEIRAAFVALRTARLYRTRTEAASKQRI
jgi:hypothetical protein